MVAGFIRDKCNDTDEDDMAHSEGFGPIQRIRWVVRSVPTYNVWVCRRLSRLVSIFEI